MQPDEQNEQWQQPAQQPVDGTPIIEEQPDETEEQLGSVQEAEIVETVPTEVEPPVQGEEELIRWEAQEHIHREKSVFWYVVFGLVVVVLMAVAFFLMQSWSFAVLVPVMAAALFLYVQRPPAVNQYTLSRKGLHINDKLYPFDSFKEFGLVKDDDEHSVMLVPRKRFHAGVTVYFPEEVGEPLVDMLAARLPMREITLDPIERLIRALHI